MTIGIKMIVVVEHACVVLNAPNVYAPSVDLKLNCRVHLKILYIVKTKLQKGISKQFKKTSPDWLNCKGVNSGSKTVFGKATDIDGSRL